MSSITVIMVYDPTRGKRISYTAAIAGHGLGGDFDYYKLTFENRLLL